METDADLTPQESAKAPLGCVPYAIGGASFIPLIGVVFGIIAIVWSIARRSSALTLLGICGILLRFYCMGHSTISALCSAVAFTTNCAHGLL
jgi:hypothetical protein